jgi:hypothetical protein
MHARSFRPEVPQDDAGNGSANIKVAKREPLGGPRATKITPSSN